MVQRVKGAWHQVRWPESGNHMMEGKNRLLEVALLSSRTYHGTSIPHLLSLSLPPSLSLTPQNVILKKF